MKKLPKISESEWLVMRVLWSKGEATANDIVRELAGRTKWNHRTVKTLITRLTAKGALTFRRDGRMYRYCPAVTQADCVRVERKSFLSRVYGGTVKPMLAAFIEDAELSEQDIADLRQILARKGRR